ncbi:Ubiquitin-conjugating enzyme E2, catalytic domain ues, variant 2 [Salvia divinorum]|uniref:E2 ubiquitin-conjugating enzyme n=1 Tax=Salvia divinorum TaxID=28513 RepID=A0ABD1G108_SALDI
MESPTPVSRYVAQRNKVFSSSVFEDDVDDVMEIPPPPSTINRGSRSKSSKKKEKVICNEIIDVDLEEDDVDVLRFEGKGKGKETLLDSSPSLRNLTIDGSGSDTPKSKHGTVDDFNPNFSSGEDEFIDNYYDDIVYDDSAVLESHFDHMNIPSGVEAPFPWLSASSTSPFDDANIAQDSHVHQSLPFKILDSAHTTSSSKMGNQAASQSQMNNLSSNWSEIGPSGKKTATPSSSSTDYFAWKYPGGSLPPGSLPPSRTSKRSRVSASLTTFFPPVISLANVVQSSYHSSGHPTLNVHPSAPGVGMHVPMWSTSPLQMIEPPIAPSTFTTGIAYAAIVPDYSNNHMRQPSTRVDKRDAAEIHRDFASFKSFDIVDDYSDHQFAKHAPSARAAQKNWAKRIQDEWKILEKDLPDTIFVRAYESRMDLLRAVIIGAEGTPYHDCLFFFDVMFPSSYPNVPPKVHYHSGGLRLNPNLYNCGKVCLSLLNTWSGNGQEKWISGVSTMLQVLVSIQGLILNAKPYFNEPGYANLGGTKHGEEKSLDYNERTFIYTLQTMVYGMRRPPKHFEAYIVGYYCNRARDILVSCRAYMDGAQVGCLAKGGVQDVDEGDKSCSREFRNNLAGFITTLINEFTSIGAKDCEEFRSLAQKATTPTPGVPGTAGFYM